jgi:hypothetical protein
LEAITSYSEITSSAASTPKARANEKSNTVQKSTTEKMDRSPTGKGETLDSLIKYVETHHAGIPASETAPLMTKLLHFAEAKKDTLSFEENDRIYDTARLLGDDYLWGDYNKLHVSCPGSPAEAKENCMLAHIRDRGRAAEAYVSLAKLYLEVGVDNVINHPERPHKSVKYYKERAETINREFTPSNALERPLATFDQQFADKHYADVMEAYLIGLSKPSGGVIPSEADINKGHQPQPR